MERLNSLQNSINRWYEILLLRAVNGLDTTIAIDCIVNYSLELELYVEFNLDDEILWQGLE